jgi:LysM repeat protein
MLKIKSTVIVASILGSLILTGCASNNEVIEKQNLLTVKTNELDNDVQLLKSELAKQKIYNSKTSRKVLNLNKKQKATADYYSVKEHDTFWGIAEKFNMSPESLLELNPDLIKPSYLLIGEIIKIK